MAFQMIHMVVAYELLAKWNWIQNPEEFILGSVAPDSVHMSETYQVEMKVKSHLFQDCGPWGDTRDYKQWIENITEYWKNNIGCCDSEQEKSFLAGVCVHCLTDYCNDLYIWRKIQKQFMPPYSIVEFKEAYYPEARGIDQWLYHSYHDSKRIMKLFASGKPFELHGLLDIHDIDKQKKHMIYTQYATEPADISGYQFLSGDFLNRFILETTERINNWLKNI